MEMKAFSGKIVKWYRPLRPASPALRTLLPVTVSTSTHTVAAQNNIPNAIVKRTKFVSTAPIVSVGAATNMTVESRAISGTTPDFSKMPSEQAYSTSTRTKPVRPMIEKKERKEQRKSAHMERERNQRRQKAEKLLATEERIRLLKVRAAEGAQYLQRIKGYKPFEYPSYYTLTCITTLEDTEQHLKHLMKQERVFGVDLEWPPTFQKGQPEKKTALVQICSSKQILLIQLSRILKMSARDKLDGFPPILRQFFQDKTIYKSGVNIYNDGLKLYRDFGIKANGLVELRDMAARTKSPKLDICHLRSLQALVALFLDKYLAKGKVQMSDWSKDLKPNQIKYAALDAYASYKLYRVFDRLSDASATLTVRNLGDEDLKKRGKSSSAVASSASPSSKPAPTRFYKSTGDATNNRRSPTETISIIKKKL